MEILTLKSKDKLGCDTCNKCCVYRGDIRLTPINVCEISKYLNISIHDFIMKYTDRLEGNLFELVLKTRGDLKECILYNQENNKCLIHSVKPMQCVMFPLYPENIKNDLFINSGQCKKETFPEIKVDNWLNDNNEIYKKHKDFCIYWISFIEDVQNVVSKNNLYSKLDINNIYRILFENYTDSRFGNSYEKQSRKNIEEVKNIIRELIKKPTVK